MARLLILAALLLADVTPRGDPFRAESARLVASLEFGRNPVVSFEFTRDARRLVILTRDGKLALWDVTTKREIKQSPGTFFHNRFTLSTDGKRAIGPSADRRSVRLVDIERGEEIRNFTDANASQVGTYALSPDGRRVALMRRDQSVRVSDAATGEDLKTLVDPMLGQGGAMAWSPDGKLLVVHGQDSTVRYFDPASGDMKTSFPGVGYTPLFMGFSPDSANLVIVTQESRVRIFDRNGRETATLEDVLTGVRVIAFSPDSRLMAASDISGKVRLWDTRTWRRLRDLDAGPVRHLAFSPDGRYLAFAAIDGSVKLWGGSGAGSAPPKVEAPRGGAPGYLGIMGNTTEDTEKGVLIQSVVAGTPAEKAGLQAGDLILKIGAIVTDDFETLRAQITALREGDEVEIVYQRAGAETKVKIKLAARPQD
jgi:WD40 repeat protein